MKEYRIGEFAHYMGVTPDLLKHYEEQGILSPSRSESGYRYYPFNMAMTLLECARLRNYGFTLREARELLTHGLPAAEEATRSFDGNVERMRREFALREALIEEYESFQLWREPLKTRESDWDIRWSRPMCFLPHTDGFAFLPDARIYELLKSWMAAIPVVKSAARIEPDGHVTWGLLVEERLLRRLELPENSVVRHIGPHKVFYFKFRAALLKSTEENPANPDHPAFRTLRALGLEERAPYYRTTLAPADRQRELIYQYGYYAIPLDI